MENEIKNRISKELDGYVAYTLFLDGVTWYRLKDILEAAESNKEPHQIVPNLSTEYLMVKEIHTPEGGECGWFINEPGIMELLLTLRTPKANRFRKWLIEKTLTR